MNFVDYDDLKKRIIGSKVSKPISGEMAGHSAGEPFDKHVYKLIKETFPNETFRQYEYLNYLYMQNLDAKSLNKLNT